MNKRILSGLNLQDIIAGLSIAGLLLPEAVAYSGLANMPPQSGIIALFAGLLCYALFGTSRFAIVSATSSSAVVLAAALSAYGSNASSLTFAIGLVFITGLFFLIASLIRIGTITDFIAKPVLRGFTFGLVITIIVKQWSGISGINTSHSNFFRYLPDVFLQYKEWNYWSILTAVIALLLLTVFSRIKYFPGGLVVIGLSIIIGKGIDFPAYGIANVGTIHLKPELPDLPELSYNDWLRLVELGLALVMVLYSESYGSIRSFALKHGDSIQPNRDLWVLGVSNIVSALFHGMPVGAGYSATSANEAAGATSKTAGMVAAITLLLIIVGMLPLIGYTPQPVLAAIVIHAVGHNLNPAVLKPYFVWKRDRFLLVFSIMSVLLLGVLDGLLVAIGTSVILLLKQFSESTISILGRLDNSHDFVDIKKHPDALPVAGILILRPDQPLFFANTERILNQARALIIADRNSIHTVIISLEESPDLDGTALETIKDFWEFMTKEEKKLVLTRLKDPVYRVLSQLLSPEYPTVFLSFLSVDDAVNIAGKSYK